MPLAGAESWQRGTQLSAWEASLLGRAAWRAEIKQQRLFYKYSLFFSICSSLPLQQAGLCWQVGSHGAAGVALPWGPEGTPKGGCQSWLNLQ